METGWLNERITILRPKRVTDQFGDEHTEYVETRTAYAYRIAQRGTRSEEANEHFPSYTAQFVIRAEHKIEDNWQVQHIGGYLYTVTNIVPYGHDRAYKTVYCERVNE